MAEQSIAQKMRARELEITAPYGMKTATVRALRDAGVAVRADGTGRWNPDRDAKNAAHPDQEAVVELARAGLIRLHGAGSYRNMRGEISYPRQWASDRLRPLTTPAAALSRERLAQACRRDRGVRVGPYRVTGSDAVEEILRRVGPAGEQGRADEARYFEAYDREQYESRRASGRDWRGISRAVMASDESAALLSFVEAGSYLQKGQTWDGYYMELDYAELTGSRRPTPPGGLHHLRISAYLVLRDASSGERHVLRVPPRFGRYRSATWQRYLDEDGEGDADGLIHAATAWTFGMEPEEYRPEAES